MSEHEAALKAAVLSAASGPWGNLSRVERAVRRFARAGRREGMPPELLHTVCLGIMSQVRALAVRGQTSVTAELWRAAEAMAWEAICRKPAP